MENRIARVFPRKTKGTPDDELVFLTEPPMLALPEIDEVHISCTFSYDRKRAEYLAMQWERVGVPVKIGGPAYGSVTDETFEPGRYIRKGYTFTSTGCHNKCWHCDVWKRNPCFKELPIKDGYIIQDDNILMSSENHFKAVMQMLKRQKEGAIFSGGLEAKILKQWHIDELREIKPKSLYFAYDHADAYEPLVIAGKMLLDSGFTKTSHCLRSYVLIGYPGDTFDAAEKRLVDTMKAGFMPFAMLYRDKKGMSRKTGRDLPGNGSSHRSLCQNIKAF